MSENDFESSGDGPSFARPRAFDTILYGGLVVGILDMVFAFTFYGLILGAQPLRIFQSVAAGLLGRTAAYEGGIRTFMLGILLHFVVATCIATVYYLASRVLPALIRHAVVSGLLYGMIAYLGMNYLIIPLSARAKIRTGTDIHFSYRNYWTRFPGWIASRAVGTTICRSESKSSKLDPLREQTSAALIDEICTKMRAKLGSPMAKEGREER